MSQFIVLRQNLLVGALLLLQALVPTIVAVLGLVVFGAWYSQPFDDHYVVLAVLAAALSLLLLQPSADLNIRLEADFTRTFFRMLPRWLLVLAILLVVGYATKFSEDFSRRVIGTWALTTPVLAAMLSVGVAIVLRRRLLLMEQARSVVIAGFNEVSLELVRRIRSAPEVCMSVHGFFDDRSEDRLQLDPEQKLLGRLPELAEYVKKHSISVIFVALPMRHVQRVMDLLDDLRDTTASIYFVPDVFVFDLIQSRTGDLLGMPVVAMCESPFHGLRGVAKRLLDFVFAFLILVMTLPIWILVAILIRLTSPGSVVFKQRRYGLDGQEIIVYKFRTMTVSEDGADFKQATKGDSRVTPIGRFLRKTSLDELPQLINILEGSMSLVGPRPHPIALNEQFRKLIKGYMIRHKVRPGLTGLAQVNGCRGETARIEDMEKRIRYDLEYLRTWTPMLDIKILFLTIWRLLRDDKAY
jgi:putative colanic acid biosysnthesis UDP-glucose lipid carrier transferase